MPNHLSIVDFESPSRLNTIFKVSNDVRGRVILLHSLRGLTSSTIKLSTRDLFIHMLVHSCINLNVL